MAGAVKQLRAENPNTVFAAAGDLIGASTFESFIDKDKPTIDALNSAGLEVSSVGNHEFDQGYDDLVNRVMAPYNASTNPKGGANWEYLAANLVKKGTTDPVDEIAPTWTKTMNGVKVGFVGAVTEHLPELVSPAGIANIDVTDIVTAVNAQADELKNVQNADIVIMLVHEGAGGTDCATMDDDPTSDFGSIITGVDENVDAVISGHTHLEYNCDFTVQDWVTEGRKVTKRPVVSAGQYGAALNQLAFDVNPGTGEIIAKRQAVLRLKVANGGPFNYPVDAPTQAIVDAAVANANVLGAQPLGQIGGGFRRAKFDNGTTENRGGESTLGNLVAEAQRWATRNPESGSAQIAFMNPGGLRADMIGGSNLPGDPFPRTLTYKQAATVQPFANTLVNMDMTGAQIKATLEQQWQPAGASRPFLRLGTSQGFTSTYDASKPLGSRITGMWLDGVAIQPGTVYSLTVNSFLASGGDNFTTLAGGTNKQDTGKTDLQGMVDYMAAFASGAPLAVDYAQHQVGVTFPAGAPASYAPGEHVTFALSSLSMTDPLDTKDSSVLVKLGSTTLGTFPVTTTPKPPADANSNDDSGTASVDVVIPAGTPAGAAQLVVAGAATGTSVLVPITVSGGTTPPPTPAPTTVAGSVKAFPYGEAGLLSIAVSRSDADGRADVFDDDGTKLGTATIVAGRASLTLAPKSLLPGTHELTVKYLGTSVFAASQATVTAKVLKAKPKVRVKVADAVSKAGGDKVKVVVTAANGVKVSGKVKLVIKGTGRSITVKLVKGKAVFEMPKIANVGTYKLKAKYLGSKLLTRGSDSQRVDVTK
ncbi:MAG: 5'-nucleotidase C-terminal domain-containing protein, partial [Nocardioides sp.]